MRASCAARELSGLSKVCVPCRSATREAPNVYDFGTPYTAIYADLKGKDAELYARNGLLPMLERNITLKLAPERWQLNTRQFDVVVAFEERVFDQILEDMHLRGGRTLQPLLVLNLDVRDNATEAGLAAPLALSLVQALQQAGDGWEGQLVEVLSSFEATHARRPLYAICYY